MPMLDGWEFLELLRACLPDKKPAIYLLTSSVSKCDREKAQAHDLVIDLVIEPLRADKLETCRLKALRRG